MEILTLVLGGAFAFVAFVISVKIMSLRRVVPTNEVHIIQSARGTKSYGIGQFTEKNNKQVFNGNTYYEWPSFLPYLGINKQVLPTNNFTLLLSDYDAYDVGRLPFLVDIASFFVINNFNVASSKIATFTDLTTQLKLIVQGAARAVLAANDIERIMQDRSTFGDQFTAQIQDQLQDWGVKAVKNMELMDIRDARDSSVIKNIMDKKKSLIDMQSRTEVALNKQKAQVAEIDAQRQVDLQKQEAAQVVGLRTIEAEQQVSVSRQQALQLLKEQEKATKIKEMNVLEVDSVRKSEIQRQMEVIKADQDKMTAVIKANAHKESTILVAEGQLEAKRREAAGIEAEGSAKAAAEKAMQLAPVEAQIVLAKEIGSNREYQEYLINMRKFDATQAIGEKQAEALAHADIKVITNSGTPAAGLTGVMDLFSARGGTEVGAMLEGLAQTETGQALLAKVLPTKAPKANGTSNLTNGVAK